MSPKEKAQLDDMQYTSSDFEEFLQQAELSGISPERQDELIAMCLAQDITLEDVLIDIGRDILNVVKKRKFVILLAVLLLGLFGFVIVTEYRARAGHTEYQPWQFEMAAFLKNWQIQLFSWFNWAIIFDSETCVVPNPYVMFLEWQSYVPVDCENEPILLSESDAASYTGPLDSEEYPLPFLFHDAQQEWKLNADSTLTDIYKVLSGNMTKTYPCVTYDKDHGLPKNQFLGDPIVALIDGKLESQDGVPMNHVMVKGCSRSSNKVMRTLTQRPVFLSPHMELLGFMDGVIAKNMQTQATVHVKKNDAELHGWIAQILGHSLVSVKDTECPDNPPATFAMKPGDILASSPEDDISITLEAGSEEVFILYNQFAIPESK